MQEKSLVDIMYDRYFFDTNESESSDVTEKMDDETNVLLHCTQGMSGEDEIDSLDAVEQIHVKGVNSIEIEIKEIAIGDSFLSPYSFSTLIFHTRYQKYKFYLKLLTVRIVNHHWNVIL